jgi:hypothetical protein
MADQPIKSAATQPEPPTRRWAVLALLGVAQLMVVLDATIVNVALPSAQRALGFSTDSRLGEIRRYPAGHFDIYIGEHFERVVADQRAFLRAHVPAATA